MTELERVLEALEAEPDISQHSEALQAEIQQARDQIEREMDGVDVTELTQSEQRRLTSRVNEILSELDSKIEPIVEDGIDDVYTFGRAETLFALGLVGSIAAGVRFLKSDEATTSRAHRQQKRAQREVTMEDLLAMTQNTRRRVKSEVRKAATRRFRSDENVRQVAREVTADLKQAGVFAIRDAAGRRWTMEHYSDVVMKTKLVEAHYEATMQEAREQEAGYFVISEHDGACPKCTPYESRVLRMDSSVPGDQPTIGDAIGDGLFHPGCTHTMTAVREPSILPDSRFRKD